VRGQEPLTFVNFRGERVSTAATQKPYRPKKAEATEFHKGWLVQGIPPGALEQAEHDHPRLIADAIAWNERIQKEKGLGKARQVPGPWDADVWLNAAKRVPVRRKPYEVPDAAQQCKVLAEKAGWLRVEVIEIKKTKEQ
jgi:hypothetical protein